MSHLSAGAAFRAALAAESPLQVIGAINANQGQNMIFTVFAAAVIGRISLNGGKGSLVGALCGVLLLGIISNILILSSIETFWITTTYGAIILLSLIATRLRSGSSY
jgi:simple sugar transport system permease protein